MREIVGVNGCGVGRSLCASSRTNTGHQVSAARTLCADESCARKGRGYQTPRQVTPNCQALFNVLDVAQEAEVVGIRVCGGAMR